MGDKRDSRKIVQKWVLNLDNLIEYLRYFNGKWFEVMEGSMKLCSVF